MPGNPLFLERKSYRLRRMMDAVRLLPLLGLALFMVPLLWPVAPADPTVVQVTQPVPMSAALKYLFGVWALLILACWALWRRTREVPIAPADMGQSAGPG